MLKYFLLLVTFFNFFLSFFVISQDRKSWNNRFFFLLSFLAGIWTFTNFMTGMYPNPFWLKSTYALGALVIPTGLIWTFILTDKLFDKKKIFFTFSIGIIFFIASFIDGFIAKRYDAIYLGGVFVGEPGFGLTIYTIYFIIVAALILYKLLSARKQTNDVKIKNQFLYVFYGALVTLVISALTSFILPSLSLFQFGGLDSIGFLIFLSFIAYAITKHHLFNIKVIATELLVFAIWVAILFELIIEETLKQRLFVGGLFIFTIIAGILLIKSVLKEVHQREEMEKLSKELQQANIQLSNKTQQLTALHYFTTSAIETLDIKQIIQTIVNGIVEKFGYPGVLLVGASDDGKYLFPLAVSENKAVSLALKLLPQKLEDYKEEIENNESLIAKAVSTNSSQISDDFSKFFSVVPATILKGMQALIGFKSAVAIPIKTKGGKIMGVLNIATKNSAAYIPIEELELFNTLANQIGIIMTNAKLFEQIEEANARLEQLNKLKSEFLSFANHQIKAPIAIIKGFSQLLMDGSYGKMPAKAKNTVAHIKESCDRLIRLVNNYLDLRKIEEGRMEYKFGEVDVAAMVKNVAEELKLIAEDKKLDLIVDVPDKEIKINADEDKLRQVVQNLTENAIKYTEKGFVKVKLATDDSRLKTNELLFSVEDSGRGISKELLPNLFNQFTRDPNAAKAVSGTGLGLFIAKEIVKAHNGEIWAESDGEGKGSRFLVKLLRTRI